MSKLSPLVLLIISLRCFNPFAPKLKDFSHPGELIITPQRTPEEVLQNFRYAYVFKDSLLYSELLDSSFVFVYFDPNEGTSGRFISWGRDMDLLTTARMFRHFDVIDLIWNSTIYSFTGEREAEVYKSFNLTLINPNLDFRISGRALFSFRKSPEDNKWRITRWKDESNL